MTSLRGWIVASSSDAEALRALGIDLGPFIPAGRSSMGDALGGYFDDCTVSPAAMTKLDPLWGRFFWGLSDGAGEQDGPARERHELLLDAICADLRAEADRWNDKLMAQGHSDDLRRHYRKMHEELRRLANRYESWGDSTRGNDGTDKQRNEPAP